jgi:hypothetical protein
MSKKKRRSSRKLMLARNRGYKKLSPEERKYFAWLAFQEHGKRFGF